MTLFDPGLLYTALDGFLFHEEPAFWLCAYRIFFAAIALVYWMILQKDLQFLYGDSGILNQEGRDRFGWTSLNPLCFRTKTRRLPACSPRIVNVILLAGLVLLLLGWHGQLAALAVFLCYAYFSARNPLADAGPEQFMRVMSFLFILVPSCKGLSLEHFFADHTWGSEEMIAAWPLQFMRVQIFFVIYQTFMSKATSQLWLKGEGVYWVMQNRHFSNVDNFPFLLRPRIAKWMNYGTLFAQCLGPIAIWFKVLHYPALAALAAVHVGLLLTVRVGLYQPLMLGSLMLFM